MAMPPRGTAGRRRRMTEGRKRLVALACAGTLLVATGSMPMAAGSEQPPTCDGQPAGTKLVVDGREVICQAPATDGQTGVQSEQAPADVQNGGAGTGDGGDGSGADGQQPAETGTAPDDAPAPQGDGVPAPQGDGEPAAPPPDTQPATAPQDDPPAGAPQSAPADGQEMPAPAAGHELPEAGQVPSGDATPGVLAAGPQPTTATGEERVKRSGTDRRPSERGKHDGERAAAHAEHREHEAEQRAARPERGKADGTGAGAPGFDALPPAWTSLDPIVLPAFSLSGFPVPEHLLPLFQAAGAEYGLPWEVLAAINEIETGYGENAGVSSAGAVGFMQFLPSTWERWGRDADGDRRRDPRNPADAIFSAARYLHAAGAAEDLPGAIFAYNHADWYVERVVTRARELAGLDSDHVAAVTDRALGEHHDLYQVQGSPFFGAGSLDPTPGQALLMTERELTRLVLKDERIDIYACGREDIEAGRIDRRVLATLLYLATAGLHPRVSSLECGHGRLTASGNVSAHSYGHAVDIAAINGTPILGHQGPGTVTDEALRLLAQLQGLMRPNQVISLMTVAGATNTLAMSDHDDHIHVGFPRDVRLQAHA
jgi:hypothetical protein